MSGKAIHTERAPQAIGPYSQAIQVGSMLFVSGQLGLNPNTGELPAGDFSGQARQALENLKAIVEAAGFQLTDVAAVDVFLTDMTRFSTFNGIYESFFSTHKPARAVVEVKGLPRGGLIEIKCTACKEI